MEFVPVALINTLGLLENVTSILQEFAQLFIEMMTASLLNILNLNFSFGGTDNFLSAHFGFLDEIYFLSQVIGFSVLFICVLFSLFKGLTGGFTETENPWILLVRALVCCGAIGAAAQVMTIVYKPGTVLLDTTRNVFAESQNAPASTIFEQTLGGNLLQFLANMLMRMVLNVILFLFNLLIFYNYIKLLLECLERWVVLAVLFYTSPIAFSMGASRNTVNVFKAWVRMVLSSMVMLCLNMAFVYLYLAAIDESNFGTAVSSFDATGTGALAAPIIYCWIVLALLKTGQKIDQYCASLGMTTAQVGTMLGAEFMHALGSMGRTALTLGRMRALGNQQAAAERQRAADAAAYRADAMKAKGLNPDGTQMVVNSGIKPTTGEMRNALQGKGAAYTGEGNAAAVSEMLGKAKDAEGNTPLAGAEILDSSVTGEGCAVINAVNPDGTLAQYKLHTSKPDGVDSTPVEMDDGSTMYLESSPVAVGNIPDIKNGNEFNENFSPGDSSPIYNSSGESVTEVSEGASVYDGSDPGTRREYGSSYMEQAIGSHGELVAQPTSDIYGNITAPHADGSITTFMPASNTQMSGGTMIVDKAGREWYAYNHSASVASQFGATSAQISKGSAEMTPTMRQNIADYMGVPVASIGRKMQIGENGYSVTVPMTGSDGEVTYASIANADTMQIRPGHSISSEDPNHGYFQKSSQQNAQAGFAVKGDTLVCAGADRGDVQRAFVPKAKSTALSAACVERYMTEKNAQMEYYTTSSTMTGEKGQNESVGRDMWKNAPVVHRPAAEAPTSHPMIKRESDLNKVAYEGGQFDNYNSKKTVDYYKPKKGSTVIPETEKPKNITQQDVPFATNKEDPKKIRKVVSDDPRANGNNKR